MEIYDVAVIGAGVVGALTARELSRYALSVCLIDRENDVARGATSANSGIVHAGFDAEPGTMKSRFNIAGAKIMPALCSELGVAYRQNGALVVGYTESDRAALRRLLEQGQTGGISGLAIVEGETLRELEPGLSSEALCALHAPTSGIVNPFGLAIAAAGNAMDNGAELRLNFTVSAIGREDGKGSFVLSDGRDTIRARFLVNAAGIYADAIARLAGDDSITIRPRRGEYLLLDKACGGLARHTLFFTPDERGKGVLLAPTADGNLLLGPTSEFIDDKEDVSTTAAGQRQVLAAARRQLPGLPAGQGITAFTGLRAAGHTGDFLVGSSVPGMVHAAGIESPGLSASPAIAEYIVELLADSGLVLRKKPDFNSIRPPMDDFFRQSSTAINEQIRHDPRYGRIICRCEQISEGEIIDALTRNPPARDTDGIKRRVRCGMGRCQGGFCLPSVAELVARKMGAPFEAVTKSGDGSRIVVGRTKGAKI